MAEATQNCPMCGEEILAIARKCKHCGEMIDVQSEQLNEPFWPISKDGKFSAKDFIKEFSVKFIKAILFIIIVVVVIIGLTKLGGKSNKPVAPSSQITSQNVSSVPAAAIKTQIRTNAANAELIVGHWECINDENEFGIRIRQLSTYNSDGTYTEKNLNNGYTDSGTYKIDGDILHIDYYSGVLNEQLQGKLSILNLNNKNLVTKHASFREENWCYRK